MRHEYYGYSKEELLANPKISLVCMADNEQVFRHMAGEMAETIEAHNAEGKTTVFICPVGPVGQYPFFVEMVNERNISLKNTWFINMDEYLDDEKQWVPMDHPLSFRGFMERTVYSKVKPELVMPPEQRVFPDPNNISYIPDLEDMPHYCVTIGIYEIAHARKIRLGCFRNWHRAVVRRAAYGEPTAEFPVTLLQSHPDLTLTFTDFVAALEG